MEIIRKSQPRYVTPFVSPAIPPDTGLNVGVNLAALVAANAGREIRLRKGTYIIDLTASGSYIDVPAGTSIKGEGTGTVLKLMSTSGTRPLFRCYGDTMIFDDMKIEVDESNAGTTAFIIFQPGSGGKNLLIGPGIEIDGNKATDGSSLWTVHAVAPDGTTNFTGIWFEGEWHHINRAWLKQNTDTAEQNMLRFTNKLYIHDMLAEAIALNTPSGRVYDVVMEHTSRDVWAAASAHIAIGSSEDVLISAKVYGKGKRAFHLEEDARRARIIGAYCEMTDTAAVGLFMTNNNVHLATQPTNVIVADSIFKGPGSTSAGSIGWQLANDPTIRGPGETFIGHGNIVQEWQKGVVADDLMLNAVFESNDIKRCGTGFFIGLTSSTTGVSFVKERVNSNRMEDVPVPFDANSGSEPFWGTGNRAGFDEFMGTTAWLTATAYKVSDVVSVSGQKYSCLVKHTSGTFATDLAAVKWLLIDRWTNGLGSNGGQSVVHNTSLARLTTGNTSTTSYAVNGVQRTVTTPYLKASFAPIRVGIRYKADLVTSMAFGFGLTDDGTTFEQPIGVDATTVQTNAATDAVVFWFSSGVTVTNWQGLGVKAGVSNGSPVDTSVAPSAATYQFMEIAIDTSGNATFYINEASVGTMANAVTPTVALTPVVYGKSRAVVTRLLDYELCFVRWGS